MTDPRRFPGDPVHPAGTSPPAGGPSFPLDALVRVTVGAHWLTASGPGAAPARTVALDPPLRAGEDPGPSLHRALALLEAEGGWDPSDHPVVVALLPPLAEARVVSLPPLADDEAELVLRRDASRHFVGAARGSVVVAVGPHDPEVGGRLAALASQALAETLLRVLRGRGYRPEALVAAQGGWVELGQTAGAGLVAAIVPGSAPGGAGLHLLHLEDGRPLATRRIPMADPETLAEALAEPLSRTRPSVPGRALLLNSPGGPDGPDSPGGPAVETREAAPRVAAALAAAGWRSVESPGGHDAATGAAPAAGPGAAGAAGGRLSFLPPSLLALHRERNRRQAVRLGVAAVLLLLVAGAVHLWGAGAQLRAVERERVLLADAVAPALVLRDSLDRMEERLASLQELGEGSGRWTFALVELAMILPPEAHLTAFRAAGDTVALEGSGGRAGDALAALRGSSSFREVRVEGPIQRDLGDEGVAAERYTLSALLAGPRMSPW
jgi:hypothetical protein